MKPSGQPAAPASAASLLRARIQSSFRLLVVTPREETWEELQRSLQPFGYALIHARSGREALSTLYGHRPDLVIAEVDAGDMDGFRLCQLLKRDPHTHLIPLVLITPGHARDDRVRGLHAGADDFLTYPFDEIELRARLRSLLRIRTLQQRLHNEKQLLEVRLRERTRELEQLTLGLVAALEKASELNDGDTGAHILRVCEVSYLLGQQLGLPPVVCSKIRRYASLHDIGKVGVPDRILKKRGKLTPQEWEEMKRHTLYGYELLRAANADPIACNIAYCHHEKFDGTGYPRGLKGRDIPVEARIVALADVFDALVTRRCYKAAIPETIAVQMVVPQAGKHFDPAVVRAFQDRLGDVLRIHATHRDKPQTHDNWEEIFTRGMH